MRDEMRLRSRLTTRVRRNLCRMVEFLFLAVAFMLAAIPAWSEGPYHTEPAELRGADTLSRALAEKLDPDGLRLVTESNGLKMEICELFWAKAVTGQEHQTGRKAHYGDFEDGALVGVIHYLPGASEDFREDNKDQKLKPGYYVMRYAWLPEEENEDVVLLSPADADGEAGQTLALDELKRRSRLASGTHQPAILSLAPAELGKEESPVLRMDDQGTCIVQVRLQVKPGTGPAREVGFAMLVVTPGKEEGGS